MSERPELTGTDPFLLFRNWMQAAEASEPNDPVAAALATASLEGVPSVRMVLIKGADEHGFSFFTNAQSHKGKDLAENPRAALCFHWKSLRRQIRVEGDISPLPDAEVDKYFHSRSRKSQIGAAVSAQSRPLTSRELMEEQVAEFAAKHPEGDVPRPDFWRGYLLHPSLIEFWMDGPDRLHDRFVFTRAEDDSWTKTRLYP